MALIDTAKIEAQRINEIIVKMKSGGFYFRDSIEVMRVDGFDDIARRGFLIQSESSQYYMDYAKMVDGLIKEILKPFEEISPGDYISNNIGEISSKVIATNRQSINTANGVYGKLEFYNRLIKGKAAVYDNTFQALYGEISGMKEVKKSIRKTRSKESILSDVVDDIDDDIKLTLEVKTDKTKRPKPKTNFEFPFKLAKMTAGIVIGKIIKEEITEFIKVKSK